MSFEGIVSNGIPLSEASRFLLGLKKVANQPTEPPDETGLLEGKFAVPVEQVLAAMGNQVQNEFETHMSYKVYAQTLRDLSHFAIAEHFEGHAGEEMDHADFLLRRMAALGGPAHIPDVQAPPASADPIDIIKRMIRMEQEAIMNWRNLRQMVGDNNPTSIAIDDYMLKEQEHVDDLWLLLPHTERAALIDESKQIMAPATTPAEASPAPEAQPAAQEAPKEAPKEESTKAAEVRFAIAAAMLKQAAAAQAAPVAASDADLVEIGRKRGLMNLGADAAKTEGYMGERGGDVLGRLGGAGIGGGVGYGLAKAVGAQNPVAQLAAIGGGAMIGQGLGGRVGRHLGLQSDLNALKEAEARFIKAANELLESAGAREGSTASPAAAAPAEAMGGPGAPDANADQFLVQEQMLQQAQDTNEANFYKQKLQEAQQQLQQSQQQAQQTQQQMDQMNQQLQSMQSQIDGAMQQGQQIQQTAMTNAQAAQAAATQAMQQTLAANSELINQQQLSANMRNAYQQLQQQIQQVAQAAPPPATTMEAGAAQPPPAMAGGAPGGPPGSPEQAGQETGPGPEATGAGQPGGEAAPAGGPAGGPPPGGQGAESGPQGAAPPQPTADGMGPQSDQTPPQPEASQGSAKQGSVSELEQYLTVDAEKYASFIADAQHGAGKMLQNHAPELIGAGVGAVGGAMLPFALKGGDEQLAALRQRVDDQEARKGELGWREELGHITDKAQIGMEEFAQKHPVASHIVGALTGAGVGAGAGTAISSEIAKRQLPSGGY